MCSEFPTSRNPNTTVTRGLLPYRGRAPRQGPSKSPFLGHSAPSQASAQRGTGAADATATVPRARHSPLGSASPTYTHLPTLSIAHRKEHGGAGEPSQTHPTPGSGGSPGPPPAHSSCRGALTKMARLKRIIMTLIKVKHPIFAPGESREVIGGTPTRHSRCRPESPAPLQGSPGSPGAGRDGTQLT